MEFNNVIEKSHWTKRLSTREEDINQRLAWIRENGTSPNIGRTYTLLMIQRLSYITALYSSGVDIVRCRAELKELIKECVVCHNNDQARYNLLTLVSMSVMLHMDATTIEYLTSIYEASERKEQIIEMLLHYLNPAFEVETQPSTKKFTMIFQDMLNGNTAPDIKKIGDFLENTWYSLQTEEVWYDSHIKKPASFDGYWCFEAGAVVVALGLDDESLRTTPYYPYRMAHYRYDVSHDVVQSRFPAIPPTQSVPVEKKEKTRSGWFFSFLKK